ncbi:thermonuclease family protein [Maritalea mobilis]|uniref:thermonuclease family protein n=1 Tax=Maritalea mobilis TaxID=483324 RepID=UPI001C975C49|nr:thermonuclease family protein [Maritalea mobilis]MBY6200810.1 thermonuclease family protein [Maritalea mobilis]
MSGSLARFLFAGSVAVVLAVASCTPGLPPVSEDGDACRVTNVVDGDTVDMTCATEGRFRARLTGYDTPESYQPGCREEAELARRATDRLRQLLRNAARVDARLGGVDRYDRRLVQLRLDGVDVGRTLIAEGLAVRYSGGSRIDWCARLT